MVKLLFSRIPFSSAEGSQRRVKEAFRSFGYDPEKDVLLTMFETPIVDEKSGRWRAIEAAWKTVQTNRRLTGKTCLVYFTLREPVPWSGNYMRVMYFLSHEGMVSWVAWSDKRWLEDNGIPYLYPRRDKA